MTLTRFLTVFALVWTLPAAALSADLAARWDVVGTITATLDGDPVEMAIPYDTENDKPYANVRTLAGQRTVNILGVTPGADGNPGAPQMQFTFWVTDAGARWLSMEVYDEQGFRKPLTIGPDGGSGGFTEFVRDGARVSARFAGEMVRMDYTDAMNPKQAEGVAPVQVDGSFEVTLTVEE